MAIDNLVSRKMIEMIANEYELSYHAKNRIKERKDTTKTIAELIYNSPLAWSPCRDKICIAFNINEYIVVTIDKKEKKEKPVILTYVNTSDTDLCVIDKFVETYMKINHKEQE